MADIQPNAQGKIQEAKKKLRTYLRQFRDDFDEATAAQRWALVQRTMIALLRIELYRIGRLGDED